MCNCADQIARASAKGHPGLAEYLATRCDRNHGDIKAASTAAPDNDPTDPEEGEAA